jgi:hypothetical protein
MILKRATHRVDKRTSDPHPHAVLPQGLVGFAGDWSNRPLIPRQTR